MRINRWLGRLALPLMALLPIPFPVPLYAQLEPVLTRPDRGFLPAGSYSIGDIETVNDTNGNVILAIPLAQLPAGRAGHSSGVSLIYNSSLYDVALDYNTTSEVYPNLPLLTQSQTNSEYGGWQYGFNYGLVIENRQLHGFTLCNSGDEAKYIYKMSFRTPDGALHLLRLKGQLDSMEDGFYDVGPHALKSACYQDPNPIASMLTYFTTDGSYIRVEIPADGTDWTAKQWTAYFPDGSRVQGYSNQATKIIDRNSNEVQIINATLSNGHPGTIIKDAFDRTIEIDYDGSKQNGAYDYIRSSGYGAALESRIAWGSTGTIDFLYPCRSEGLYCNALISHSTINEILLPASGPGKPQLSYTFTYSGNSTGGFGEVKSVTTPGGVTATYDWFMEGLAPWEIGPIRNPIKHRHLTYTEKRDGASTQISETTTYEFDAQWSIITYPDGGVRTVYFTNPRSLGSWSRGLVDRIENPDGSVLQRQWLRNRPVDVPKNDAGNPYVRTEILSVASGSTLTESSAKVYSYL